MHQLVISQDLALPIHLIIFEVPLIPVSIVEIETTEPVLHVVLELPFVLLPVVLVHPQPRPMFHPIYEVTLVAAVLSVQHPHA